MSAAIARKNLAILLAPALLLITSAVAANHPDFSGSWKLNSAGSRIKDSKLSTECAKLTIAQKDASITISESEGHPIECSTAGKECQVKNEGKLSKVSFWFDGAKLVQMEITGHAGEHIRKRQLSLSPSGKTMQMEVIPISPAGEASLLAFDKDE